MHLIHTVLCRTFLQHILSQCMESTYLLVQNCSDILETIFKSWKFLVSCWSCILTNFSYKVTFSVMFIVATVIYVYIV